MLVVEVDGERRRAWADESMVGPAEVGDDVVVNTAALDLGLGSGGYDIVHVNLTRGLEGGETPPGVHVMKLNYSSLQHAVDPIELPADAPARAGAAAAGARPAAARPPRAGRLGGGRGRGRRGSASSRPAAAGLPGGLSGDVREAAGAGPDRRLDHRFALLRRRARGDQPDRRAPRGGRARLGRGRSSAPGPGSSAPRPATATAGWRRSTPPTPRSRSACRRSSRRGCRRATRGRATSASATTPARCSSCCSAASRCRFRRGLDELWPLAAGEPVGRARGGAGRPAPAPRGRRSTSPATPSPGCRSGRWAGPSTRTGSSSPRRCAAGRGARRRRLSGRSSRGARVRGLHRQGTGHRAERWMTCPQSPRLPLPCNRSMPASRRCSSTSSPTSSSSAACRATP